MVGFVRNASGNVSPKKNSKKLNDAVNAKLDSAVRLEADAASVSRMDRKNQNNRCNLLFKTFCCKVEVVLLINIQTRPNTDPKK